MDNSVKVDIQKLQLLNDRIAQTIDALNQVRMSVHGIQHTSPVSPYGVPPYASPYASPFTPTPYPFMQPGLSHSTPFAPFAPQAFGQPTPFPGFINPYLTGGLGHSTAGIDPNWIRTQQAWPYVQQQQMQQMPFVPQIPFNQIGIY